MNDIRAFPTYHGGYAKCDADGMSLRDYFAARALQGLLSNRNAEAAIDEFAVKSYRMADAMMKARQA